jgi:hypothetical protein
MGHAKQDISRFTSETPLYRYELLSLCEVLQESCRENARHGDSWEPDKSRAHGIGMTGECIGDKLKPSRGPR